VDECKPLLWGNHFGPSAAAAWGALLEDCRDSGAPIRSDIQCRGRAVQVDPIEPTLKAPGTKRLKLKYDVALSNFAFNFNLRRYTEVSMTTCTSSARPRSEAFGVWMQIVWMFGRR